MDPERDGKQARPSRCTAARPSADHPFIADHRDAPRCGFAAPVAVTARTDVARGYACDLSNGGAGLLLDAEFEVGDYVCVKFPIAGEHRVVEVLARVRYRKERRHGVEFCIYPSDPEAANIRHLLEVALQSDIADLATATE